MRVAPVQFKCTFVWFSSTKYTKSSYKQQDKAKRECKKYYRKCRLHSTEHSWQSHMQTLSFHRLLIYGQFILNDLSSLGPLDNQMLLFSNKNLIMLIWIKIRNQNQEKKKHTQPKTKAKPEGSFQTYSMFEVWQQNALQSPSSVRHI